MILTITFLSWWHYDARQEGDTLVGTSSTSSFSGIEVRGVSSSRVLLSDCKGNQLPWQIACDICGVSTETHKSDFYLKFLMLFLCKWNVGCRIQGSFDLVCFCFLR